MTAERPEPVDPRTYLVRGIVLGASSRGVIVADADLRAILDGTDPEATEQAPDVLERIQAHIRQKAKEQGIDLEREETA